MMMRRLLQVGGVLTAAVGLPCYGLYSGNDFLFPKALRLVCLGVRIFSNTRISFDEAYGSVKHGRLKMTDAKISSVGNTTKDFNVQINSLEIVYGKKFFSFLRELEQKKKEEIQIEKLFIKGITGKVDIRGEGETPPDFCFKELSLENIQLEVTDHTKKIEKSGPFTFPPVALYRLYGRDLHTKNLAKDLILKSSFLASLGTGVAGLEPRKNGIYFAAKNIPLGAISKYLAEPFSWFTQALLDAEINDVITAQNHSMNIDMKLHKLVLDSANASKNGRTAIPIISSYIKQDNPQISMSFSLRLEEDEFTLKNVSRRVAKELVMRGLQEGGALIGQRWEDLKQAING